MSLSDEIEKLSIWQKATPIAGYDTQIWRQDKYGYVMQYNQYGQTSQFGWEKDHIFPASLGGANTLANYQALHWRANRQKRNYII
ncbi:hypothetical protein MXMO3_01978 [Maritalea myrionectae]|uniref:HNH domain-containing protein n=1 Tax=Maritalea myrionectae TaxID=454601 RepID=A0A2R4MER3_9HYPH|nr:HNH endonuclease [Maritalea myrionectae]AVX04502.1 hypothetical protein MXMO3_01978 [Maritalea myrionectae]